MQRKHDRIKIILVAVWLAFTVTLAAWWLIFGLRQLDRLVQLHVEEAEQLHQHYRMLLWEGGVLIGSLLGGGLALFYYIRREKQRHAQVEEFFAAFTHDAKTALASLRLQAESLKEDLGSSKPSALLDRLLQDTLRLQLQLENSLFLVNLPSGNLFLEPVSIGNVVGTLRHHWPDLTIIQKGDGVVIADVRAIESVLTNLVQNAVIHGQASQIAITVERNDNGRLAVRVVDDGRGFDGDLAQLGKLFVRHARGSGSGVGLYISRQLLQRMNSALSFGRGEAGGFAAAMDFPAAPEPRLTPQRREGMA